ncbi:MAG: HD domain-containing protein [Candidatus Shapirobacteria bacterium]
MVRNPEQYHSQAETQLSQTFKELKVNSQDEAAIGDFLGPLKEKDKNTYEHCLRVALLAKEIGGFMELDEKALFFAGLLHDLGKLNVPMETLGKTDSWTKEDSKAVEKHVIDGYLLIKGRFDFTAEIILWHHKFQENKYPEFLPPYLHDYSVGTQAVIPEYGRILALADVYDALHRENSKFGERKTLSEVEIKDKMLEFNPDKLDLVNDLYTAKIFG